MSLNTNPSKADRARYIERAQAAGFEVICYFFETDLNSALERNSHRTGKANIPEVGVRATYKKLEYPTLDEGFEAIFKVKIVGNGEFLVKPI